MVWIFGYGSLIWKVDFPYQRKLIGFIEGYKRRFWWWSEDHRGIPGDPGRVVNLLSSDDPKEKIWGIAYEISEQDWNDKVRDHLDHREKGGYTQHTTRFIPDSTEDFNFPEGGINVTLYIGSPDHRQYAGPAPMEEMAKTILNSVGPSGPNIDYLLNLADAMKNVIHKDDEHIIELVKAVERIKSCR